MADDDYRRLSCVDCSATFPRLPARGRPRKRCYGCSPAQTKPPGTYRKDTSTEKVCARCLRPYVARIAAGKFCSADCRVAAGNACQVERLSAAKRSLPERACKWCAAKFKPEYGDKRRLYCSTKCEQARRTQESSGNTHRRRAKRFGVPYQHVNRLRVFERDNWRCQLCRRKVTLRSAELDHIVPLSKGGAHTYQNTQCSCSACNSRKRDKPLGQQRLFG